MNIKVEEIRIGNWFMGFDGPFQWQLSDFWLLENGSIEEIIKEPIPLSPEILERCGFEWETEKKKHLQLQMSEELRLTFYVNGIISQAQIYQDPDVLGVGMISFKPPKHLHEMQNLFYSLTTQELTINL